VVFWVYLYEHNLKDAMASENELSVPKTLDVINELGLRVSQADLASATGASLFDAQRRLNEIAARTGAVLEVSEAGQITYCFKPGFQSAYVLSGYAAVVQDSLFALSIKYQNQSNDC
jgi:hypothetical protein